MSPPKPARPVLSPVQLGPLELRNRIVKAATYETRSRNGFVTDELVSFHREFARGGVGATTLAYCAVSPEGRTFRDQVWMNEAALPGLADFARAVHAEGAAACAQLAHAGWFADPSASGEKPLGPSRHFSPHARTFARALGEADMERIVGDFARATRLAGEAGFDAVEVHVGHGYLLSQFLSPFNNRRRDDYGGSLANRGRFPRRVLEAVRAAGEGQLSIWAKLNMDDGFRGGLSLDDSLAFAKSVEADGTVDALQLTGGHTTKSPMYLMRGRNPLPDLFARDPNRLRGFVMRTSTRLLVRDFPFEEAWFLPKARAFRDALGLPLMLLGGVTTAERMDAAIEEGFAAVALGRALLAEPDLAKRLAAGSWSVSSCTACNECVGQVGRTPTRCVLQPTAALPQAGAPR